MSRQQVTQWVMLSCKLLLKATLLFIHSKVNSQTEHLAVTGLCFPLLPYFSNLLTENKTKC